MSGAGGGGLREFIRELRRRRVFRVLLVYGAAVFAILQAADIVVPALGLPETFIRVLVVFSLLGFPITLAVAWVYDLTPAGIIRTSEQDAEAGATVEPWIPRVARTTFILVTAGLVIGAGYLSWRWASADRPSDSEVNPKSVAVLPFVDVNNTDSTAFFADGLHDDVITQLSKVEDLFVISRTSVMQYEGSTASIPEIGAQLGVRTVLEGSVRQAAGRVRVDTRLIDTRSDQTLWVESYERDQADVLAIQGEIAQQIASALQAELSPAERERLAAVPTESREAWQAFKRAGLHMDRRENLEDALTAIRYYETAAERDPTFAAAFAGLSQARMWLYWNWPGYGDQLQPAVEAMDRAVELDPDGAPAHMAQGYFHFYGRGDNQRALEHFNIARQLRPGDAEAMAAVGLVQRRQGQWQAAVESFRAALAQDPRSYNLTLTMAETLQRMRQFGQAEARYDEAIALAPTLPGPYRSKILLRVEAQGDTLGARLALEEYRGSLDPDVHTELEGILAYYRGDFPIALDRLGSSGTRNHRMLGLTLHAMGRLDQAAVQGDSLAQQARSALASLEESGLAVQPGLQARARSDLALAEALRGERFRAWREGQAAVEILPLSEDALDGADNLAALGLTLALIGEHQAAVVRLDSALAVPSSLTRAELELDPAFADLRVLGEVERVTQDQGP